MIKAIYLITVFINQIKDVLNCADVRKKTNYNRTIKVVIFHSFQTSFDGKCKMQSK